MWRKDLTAIVVAGLVLSLVSDVRARAQTPAADGLRSDWHQVLDLKENTTVRIDLQDGSVVKGRMKMITAKQVVVMASNRVVILDRPDIRRITISPTKGGTYAKRGALIGLGWGVVTAALGGQVVQQIASSTGFGALIGFLVGQGHSSEQVIYDVSANATTDWRVYR